MLKMESFMIQVIERFHCILEKVVASRDRPVKSSELVSMLNISAPACANILRTMVKLEYLRRGVSRGEYLPGPCLQRFSQADNIIPRLLEAAKPIIEQLASDIGEFVVLVNDNNGIRNELVKVQGQNSIQLNIKENHAFDNLLQSLTGLILLSYRSYESRQAYWKSNHVSKNILSLKNLDDLEIACEKIRTECGFSQSNFAEEQEEYPIEGYSIMGFPVKFENQIVAALGMRIPAYRYTRARHDDILKKCHVALEKINTPLEQNNSFL
jgi:DNA-binding IclR family transcriptional regulator